jgi:hypothetical protein
MTPETKDTTGNLLSAEAALPAPPRRVLIMALLILFAITHFAINSAEPGSYSHQMTRLDALYSQVDPPPRVREEDNASLRHCEEPISRTAAATAGATDASNTLGMM